MFTKFTLIFAMLMYLSPPMAKADMLVFDTGSVIFDISEKRLPPFKHPSNLVPLLGFYVTDFDELLPLPPKPSFIYDLRHLRFSVKTRQSNPPNHVPEPVTMVLFGIGLMGLGSLRLKK